MKQISSLLLLLILVSCANIQVTEVPVISNTIVIPTTTSLPSTPLPTSQPPTPTTITSCDPFSVDFCVTAGHFILQRPIQPPANNLVDVTYRYGSTANGSREPHHGVEFSNPSGTPVYAAAEGTVIFAGPDKEAIYSPWGDFYGNLVVIEHGDDLFTLYAHLSRIDVEVNQSVFAGAILGEVGRTGGAIGSHLHFEVRRGDEEDYFSTQNPELWLVPAKDENGNSFGVLMLSVVDEDGRLVKNLTFTIGQYPDLSESPTKIIYGTAYAPDLLRGDENAVFSELTTGHYRIAVEMNGQILERWVEVESGRLTQVVFVAK